MYFRRTDVAYTYGNNSASVSIVALIAESMYADAMLLIDEVSAYEA